MLNQVHPRWHRLGGAEVGGEPGLAEQETQTSFFPYKPPCLLVCKEATVGGTAQSSAVCAQWVLSHCYRSLHLRSMSELMQLNPLLLWYRWRQWSQRSQAKTLWGPHGLLGASRLIHRPGLLLLLANNLRAQCGSVDRKREAPTAPLWSRKHCPDCGLLMASNKHNSAWVSQRAWISK